MLTRPLRTRIWRGATSPCSTKQPQIALYALRMACLRGF
jgi:hypothetical protein